MLTLIDGNSILFRAYYGVGAHLTRRDGTPVGAVFGFMNMMLPILAAADPRDAFVCVFDASRISFRQDIYPEYKANRAEPPADLIAQGELVRRGCAAIGMPVLCIPGVEADDVIATIARNNCHAHDATRIITSDKDLMQLVSDCVYIYDGMKAKEIRAQEVIEKFGVPPNRVVDSQALIGDTSDNVPGVHGIGPKKAAELITQFGSLDALYENLDAVKNERVRGLLRDGRDAAFMSRRLVTLKDDVDLTGLNIAPFVFNRAAALEFAQTQIESGAIAAKIMKLFPAGDNTTPTAANEFSYPASECPVAEIIPEPAPTPAKTSALPPQVVTVIHNAAELKRFLAGARRIIAFDTETTGLDMMRADLVGISIAIDAARGAYIPLRHVVHGDDLFSTSRMADGQMDARDAITELMPIFENPDIIKVGHNLKYDLHILANVGVDIARIGPIDDTMLLSYALHGTRHTHGLDELATRYLGHENITFASLFPDKMRDADRHFADVEIDAAARYAAEDATVTFALYELMRGELDANEKLRNLYDTCDLPLMPILVNMERRGVLVNRAGLQQLSTIFHDQMQDLQSQIWADAGHEFNIASPKQLATVLFDELKLPANKKRSTDADALSDITDAYPIVEKILGWRTISKLAGTYADALPKQIADDGRIHTTYLQTSTNTGRLSSRDPNLQNIPIKTHLGEEIRKCFIAPAGHKLISVDYSQVQLRLLADVAGVHTFRDTFINGADIHEQTARKIFNIPADAPVPRDMRRAAKTVNFSIIYGISSWGLATQLGVSRGNAADIINSYMAGLPEVKDYIESTKEFAAANACVYTPWGRRIELPDVNNPRTRAYAMRAAVNAPIQGFEADIMRRAMVEIYNTIVTPNADKIQMIMQVHDEMVFECVADMAEEFATRIKYAMENITKLSVPLVAEYVIDDKWGK